MHCVVHLQGAFANWAQAVPAHPEPWKAIGTQIQGLGRKQETMFIEPPTALGFALYSSRPREPLPSCRPAMGTVSRGGGVPHATVHGFSPLHYEVRPTIPQNRASMTCMLYYEYIYSYNCCVRLLCCWC